MVRRLKVSIQKGGELYGRFRGITNHIFWHADTTTARLILALSSFMFALSLWTQPHGFDRQAYDVMRSYATSNIWAWMFFTHSIGVLWRFLDPKPRIYAALAVNVFGLGLWLHSTICINLALHAFSPGTSVEFITCFFGAWALFRTGLSEEMVSP